jgi:FAD-dependent oxidoreductase domain-containing protein 1
MSQFGVGFFRELKARFDAEADISFRERGYLLLAGDSGAATLAANHAVQIAEGASIVLLDRAALARKLPWLNASDLTLGAFGQSGEGWFDAHSLLALLRDAARRKGARYVHGEVTGIERAGARVAGVRLADGERIPCGALVNAAGPQAGDVAALAGIVLPVEPRKRCVFVVACRTALPGMPLMVDPGGVWIRPEGEVYICGVSPPEETDTRAADFEVDYALFDDVVWPALAHRVPAMEMLKMQRAWAGHYDYNTLDQNAVIGRHPDITNLIFANGFSGHGLQQSPATGRAVAELITRGRFISLDLTLFGYERVMSGRAVKELNVI